MNKYILTVLLAAVSGQVLATGYPVMVTSSIPITGFVVPELNAINGNLGTINGTLGKMAVTQQQIGQAVNTNGNKISSMIEESTKNMMAHQQFARQSERLEKSRRNFEVPETICTESTSGAAALVGSHARETQSQLSHGGGVSNTTLKNAITEPTPSPDQVHYQNASLHQAYCDETDHKAYGGTRLCKKVSDLPGGDKQLSSLLDGAGKPGKRPDLTFNQQQTDAAMTYAVNTTSPDAGRQLTKGEVASASGEQYIGLLVQYQATMSAAREPQLALIAASQPDDATSDALAETLKVSSAKSYFEQTASDEAKKSKKLSQREFELFEAGRRYANTNYLTDLQQMSGDNLLRELIRVQSLNNWLLVNLKREQEKANILSGQLLALQARQVYQPQLEAKLEQVKAGIARE